MQAKDQALLEAIQTATNAKESVEGMTEKLESKLEARCQNVDEVVRLAKENLHQVNDPYFFSYM